MMQLFVKLNTTFVVDVDENATVKDLQEIIYEKSAIEKKHYFLTGNGRLLGEGKLSNYNLDHGSTVHMSMRLCPTDNKIYEENDMQIFLKFDKIKTFDVNKKDTMENLKNKIYSTFGAGYEPHKYFLTFNGRLLSEGILEDFGVEKHSTIHGSFRSQFCEYQST